MVAVGVPAIESHHTEKDEENATTDHRLVSSLVSTAPIDLRFNSETFRLNYFFFTGTERILLFLKWESKRRRASFLSRRE